MSGVVILINGYPAVGKLAVAKELVKLLPNAKLLDSHLINEAVGAIHEEGSERYEQVRGEMTHTLLSALHPPLPNTPIYILPTTLTHSSRPLLAPVLALHGSFAIIHIILYCSTSIHVARLLADKEHRHARGKISDEASLMELKMEDQILHLVGGPYGAGVGDGKVAAEYEINTTVIDAKMVAGLAAEYAVQGLRNAGVFVVMEKRRRP